MNTKKNRNFTRFIITSLGLLLDAYLCFQAFFVVNPVVYKLIYFLAFELTLSLNVFLMHLALYGPENSIDVFYKNSTSKLFFVLIFLNINEVIISVLFGFTLNPLYLFGLILPILHFILLFAIYRYLNFDSIKLKNDKTNKYLGVAVSNHFVFDGVDVLAEQNNQKIEFEKLQLINPFNPIFSCMADNVYYVNGKDYKFYVATCKIDELYTLVFLVRNKDAYRFRLNKQAKQDFELNKNIFVAYCLENEEKEPEFTYVGSKLRYKITALADNAQKSHVQIEQKTELPHLNARNKISQWFGDGFNFATKDEADAFVKLVIKETGNGEKL